MNAVILVLAAMICVAAAKPHLNFNLDEASEKKVEKRECSYDIPLNSCEQVWCREACKRHKLPRGEVDDYHCCAMDCLSGKYPSLGEKGDFEGHKMKVMDAYCRYGRYFRPPVDLKDLNCCATFQSDIVAI